MMATRYSINSRITRDLMNKSLVILPNFRVLEVELIGLNQKELNQSVKKVEQWLDSIPTNKDETSNHSGFLLPNEVRRLNRKPPARRPSMKHLVALAAAAITALATLSPANPTNFHCQAPMLTNLTHRPDYELLSTTAGLNQHWLRPGDEMTPAFFSLHSMFGGAYEEMAARWSAASSSQLDSRIARILFNSCTVGKCLLFQYLITVILRRCPELQ